MKIDFVIVVFVPKIGKKLKIGKFFSNIKNKVKNEENSILGIDLGTTYTLICLKNKGIVLNESSTISYINDSGVSSNFLYGNEAKDLIGKTPIRIEVSNPLEDGVICDHHMSEKKAIQDILERCNAKEAYLCYESILAAVGSGLPIDKPYGSMVIDIGGGTTEISVISLGGIIKTRAFKYGGRRCTDTRLFGSFK